jgi:IS5 family transposase
VQLLAGGKRLDGGNRFLADARDPRHARARAHAVEQHRARAALPFAAAIAAAGQAEVVAQDRQEVVARLGVNLPILPVDA